MSTREEKRNARMGACLSRVKKATDSVVSSYPASWSATKRSTSRKAGAATCPFTTTLYDCGASLNLIRRVLRQEKELFTLRSFVTKARQKQSLILSSSSPLEMWSKTTRKVSLSECESTYEDALAVRKSSTQPVHATPGSERHMECCHTTDSKTRLTAHTALTAPVTLPTVGLTTSRSSCYVSLA